MILLILFMSLNNFFKQKNKEQVIQVFPKKRNKSQLIANSFKRISQSINDQSSELITNAIKKGAIPLIHESQHKFRDRIKSKEIHNNKEITLKSYLPSRERALTTQQDHLSAKLPLEAFDETQPHKSDFNWLRVRHQGKEGVAFRFGIRSRIQNINTSNIALTNQSVLDHS